MKQWPNSSTSRMRTPPDRGALHWHRRALQRVTVAWFDLQSRKYQPIEINEQVEVLSLIGDVAESEGKPAVHAHICVAKRNSTAPWRPLTTGRCAADAGTDRRRIAGPFAQIVPAGIRYCLDRHRTVRRRPRKTLLHFVRNSIMSVTVGQFLMQRMREMGSRADLCLSRRWHQRAARGPAEKRGQAPFHPGPARRTCGLHGVGHAKFTGTVGVCMATSGPGEIHLLNGLYDAKMDHQSVVAIVGQSATTAIGSQYQQEVDLQSLFKDVASEYCVTVMNPGAVRHCIDRAFRIATDQTFGYVRHHSQGHSRRESGARSATTPRLCGQRRRLPGSLHDSAEIRIWRLPRKSSMTARKWPCSSGPALERERRGAADRRDPRGRGCQKLARQGRHARRSAVLHRAYRSAWQQAQLGT